MKAYNIPYTGLKLGKHSFDFTLDSAFFEEFKYEDIHHSKIDVQIELEKSEVMIVAHINAQGTIKVQCDRCNDLFETTIAATGKVIFKYTDEEIDDDVIIGLLPSEHELKMADPIYQTIIIHLPIKFAHEDEADCNQEMIEILDEYRLVEEFEEEDEEPIDPRWEALKNLNKDKNK